MTVDRGEAYRAARLRISELVSDDVMGFMGQVDAVLLVAAAETTTTKEIDACERELAGQTNVMGVVLNKCRYANEGYGYDYGAS